MKRLSFLVGFTALSMAAFAGSGTQTASVAPAEALQRLSNGNARFVAGRAIHPDQSPARLAKSAKGQSPFAIVLTCSDSRLSPELIFDQGVGSLFVVRVAGNTADPIGLGSMEYAVAVLGARTIVVMGHEKCGAVQAAVKGGELPGSIGEVTKPIQPAVERVKGKPKEVELAITENVRETVRTIRTKSKIIADLEKQGKLRILGSEYHLAKGQAHLFRVDGK
jgi:carbonic anhydrase